MQPSSSEGERGPVPAIEEACSAFFPLLVTPLGSALPSIDARCHVLPDLCVGTFAGTPIRTERTRAHTADAQDDIVLCLERKARVRTVDSYSGEREFAPGDAHVWMAPRPSVLEVNNHFSSLIIAMPRDLVQRGVADLDRVLRTGIPSAVPELRLLTQYAQGLVAELGSMTPDAVRRCAGHIQDLVFLALGPVRDAAEVAKGRGLRAARLRAIKASIGANLNNPELSLDWLAKRHRVSPRAIRDLFYAEGTNFTDYLLGARLDRARALLRDPARNGQTITAIAFEAGFGDLSWFYRVFRRRFGISPSGEREHARLPGGHDLRL